SQRDQQRCIQRQQPSVKRRSNHDLGQQNKFFGASGEEEMSLPPRDEAMMEAIGQVLIDEIERAVAPLRQRIAELEQRGVEYRGTHQRAQEYKRGSLVTFEDALWCAVTNAQPGEIPGKASAWQLCLRGPQAARSPTVPRTQGSRP